MDRSRRAIRGHAGKEGKDRITVLPDRLVDRPFVDDNRRVAFSAMDVFLRLNGWKISVDAQAAHSFLVERFQSGTCEFERLLPWIRGALVRNRDLDPGSSPG